MAGYVPGGDCNFAALKSREIRVPLASPFCRPFLPPPPDCHAGRSAPSGPLATPLIKKAKNVKRFYIYIINIIAFYFVFIIIIIIIQFKSNRVDMRSMVFGPIG